MQHSFYCLPYSSTASTPSLSSVSQKRWVFPTRQLGKVPGIFWLQSIFIFDAKQNYSSIIRNEILEAKKIHLLPRYILPHLTLDTSVNLSFYQLPLENDILICY